MIYVFLRQIIQYRISSYTNYNGLPCINVARVMVQIRFDIICIVIRIEAF